MKNCVINSNFRFKLAILIHYNTRPEHKAAYLSAIEISLAIVYISFSRDCEGRNMCQRLFLVLIGIAVVTSRRCTKFYRKDYSYIDQFDAFYKLHWDQAGQTWSSAFLACDEEGASLFYPKTTNEWTVVKGLTSTMKNKPNVTEIFVGIHDEFGLGEFMTVDGLSTPSPLPEKDKQPGDANACVTMDIDTGAYILTSCDTDYTKPFVCKKVEKAEPACPTIDLEYTYYKETKKCYKFSQRKKSWTDAMQTCFMEGGVLAVITNNIEAQTISYNMESGLDYFVGFRRLFPNGDFYTVKGQQYDNSFFKNWRERDDEYQTGKDCGVIEKGNDLPYTSTRNCLQPTAFVCEMPVNI